MSFSPHRTAGFYRHTGSRHCRGWHWQLKCYLCASSLSCSPLLQGPAAARTASGAEGLAVAAERFQEALAAKDELLSHLDGELAERRRQAAAYEGR